MCANMCMYVYMHIRTYVSQMYTSMQCIAHADGRICKESR